MIANESWNKSVYLNNALETHSGSVNTNFLSIEDRKNEELLRLLSIIREICWNFNEWRCMNIHELQIQPLVGGITNRLLCFELFNTSDKLVVRLYGNHTEDFISRFMENYLFAELSKAKFSPVFYGTFTTGRIEGYLPGSNFEPEELSMPVNSELIAKAMASMHLIDIPVVRYLSSLLPQEIERLDKKQFVSWEPVTPKEPYQYLWKRFELFFQLAFELQFPLEKKKFETLQLSKAYEEFIWFRTKTKAIHDLINAQMANPDHPLHHTVARDRLLGRSFAMEEVLCHNDLLAGNIMKVPITNGSSQTKAKGEAGGKFEVMVIDYEYSGYNYCAFDLGNHFCGK
jgi:thiamine kinase-like enzyme